MALPMPLDVGIRVFLLFFFVLNLVLALTYLERKVIGRIQQRLGPMRTGPFGLLQAPADAIKLLTKEDLIPANADKLVFKAAPYAVFVPLFVALIAVPFTSDLLVRSMDMGIFYFVAVSSFSIVGVVMAGYGSSNKYALLGGVRAAAQMVSYELPLVMSILGIAMLTESLNLKTIVEQQGIAPFIILQPVGLFIFIVSALAELNRSPFDIPVAESEVVGGPYVEYSGMRWGIFYLAEYANLFAICALGTLLFLGGWTWPFLGAQDPSLTERVLGVVWFFGKTFIFIFAMFWLRATLPRLRIDQLMTFAWKLLLPLAFVNLFITGVYLINGWPSWTLFLMSAIVIIAAGYIVYARENRRVPA